MTALTQFTDEFLRLLLANEDGLSNDKLKTMFSTEKFQQLPSIINSLLSSNRIQIFTQGNSLVYKAIKEEIAVKFDGLNPEQILVYQVIERSGNKGIWTRDIKTATNVPQHTLTKALKILEQKLLIKSVRSVVSKSKKLYVLFDVVPAKEITGGPWYSDQEFDHEFVSELGNFIVQLVYAENMMDLSGISQKIKSSGISKIELSNEETELIVNTLVYDGRLEEIQSSVLLLSGYAVGKKVYKVSKLIIAPDHLTNIPCGTCPVIHQCCDGGIINPNTCLYLTQWMDSANNNNHSFLPLLDTNHNNNSSSMATTINQTYSW